MRPARLALLGLMLLAGSQPVAAQSPQVDEPATTIEADEPRPGPPPPLPDLSEPNGRAGEALNEPGERSGIPKALRGSGSKAGGGQLRSRLETTGVVAGAQEWLFRFGR